MSVLSARGIKKSYGARTLFADVDVTIEPGDRIGLLGINGTGKSTLLRVLAGEEPYDEGVLERGRGLICMHLTQEPKLDDSKTIAEAALEGLASWTAANARYEAVCERAATGDEAALLEQGEALEDLEREGGFDRGHEALAILAQLGVHEHERSVAGLSGGERRRVALARILVAKPDFAILDEPTNHLDAETIEWLERFLRQDYKGALLFVTHDRYVLDAVATRIIELDRGTLERYKGNYAAFLDAKAERVALEERTEAKRQNLVRRETEWLRRGAKARSTKQKARIDRAEALIADKPIAARGDVLLAGADASRLGGRILEFENVTVAPHGRTLVRDLSLIVNEGTRIGIVGRNGTGKTSILRLVAGDFEPTQGRMIRGKNTRIAYFDQARANLEDDWTVFENVAERQGGQAGPVETADGPVEMRSYLERFQFDGHAQRQKVASLSGGERARVALAKLLKGSSNVLLLDEPTNDLDIQTLGALEDMISTFKGCVLFVSHDRYFLNAVATGILEVDGETANATLYEGDFDFFLERREALRVAKKAASAGARNSSPPKSGGAALAIPKAAQVLEPAANSKAAKSKLTYAERIELEGIMDKIGASEAEASAADAQLADGQLFVKNPKEAQRIQGMAAAARAQAEGLTTRWELLEAKQNG